MGGVGCPVCSGTGLYLADIVVTMSEAPGVAHDTNLGDLLSANAGDDYVARDLIPRLVALKIGERLEEELGAGGETTFTRIR
jgi:uncharacterized protein YbaR (Trm112 family)